MMTSANLASRLAARVMGWTVGPERYLLGGRQWIPRWRFRPAEKLQDAYRLLERAAPQNYTMGAAEQGGFWAKVRIGGVTGEAHESSQARALTFAVARALGIDVEASR